MAPLHLLPDILSWIGSLCPADFGHQIAELQKEVLLSRRQHAVDNVVLALVGVLDRLELLLIVLLADVNHRPILRFGKPDIGENAVVGDLVDREVAVNNLVVAVDAKTAADP